MNELIAMGLWLLLDNKIVVEKSMKYLICRVMRSYYPDEAHWPLFERDGLPGSTAFFGFIGHRVPGLLVGGDLYWITVASSITVPQQ